MPTIEKPVSWLEKLAHERVFSVDNFDGKFQIREECDGHYSVELTAEELRALALELLNLAGGGRVG